MKVTCNEMNALSFVVLTVTITGSLGGFAGYQFYTQPIAAPYVSLPVAQPSLHFAPAHLPQHYYSPPGNTYSGFSYQTNYPDGGSSQVVFVTGPQSRQLMQQSIASFRQIQPDQAKLGILSVTPKPKFRVLTVAPPQETNTTPATTTIDSNSAPTPNSTPAPLPNSVPLSLPNTVFSGIPQASVYRVQVFPSHLPQISQFVHTPFPYHPVFASFYNTAPQANGTSSTQSLQQENANEAQESMISEVGALPTIVSNEIDSSTTTISAMVDAQTSSTTTTQNAASEQDTNAQEFSSPEGVTTNAPQLSSIVTAELTSPETETTSAQEPSITEVSSESTDIGNRIQAEASTQAGVEEGATTESASSEAGSSTTVAQETTTPAVTTEPSANSGVNEQTTVEQTTEA